ncbi:MAG: threonylcarbamoyl-AMP synthase [Lactobacillales bacterium]|jgi:L-threonylcarbamoyladenylate synthase|nr:threonylcarbamoyl-AMP synthase [Lactobacillales bacterium]
MTQILQPKEFEKAIKIIKQGGLVAFPTETVYGLGADARNQEALDKIFAVKKRSLNNPLHLNISDVNLVNEFVEKIPATVQKVMDIFWPGPLTIILPLKKGTLPDIITGSLSAVGFRMPQNEIALALIRSVGIMVGPSANISGNFSPTRVEHVLADLDGKIDAVLDDGESLGGIESTILDVSTFTQPKILRSGAITREMLEEFFPNLQVIKNKKHYMPNVSIIIINSQKQDWSDAIAWAKRKRKRIGLLTDKKIIEKFANHVHATYVLTENNDINLAVKRLFAGLRKLDKIKQSLDVVFVQSFDGEGLTLAYRNCLLKAAGS